MFPIIVTILGVTLSIVISITIIKLGHGKDDFQRGVILTVATAALLTSLYNKYDISNMASPLDLAAEALSDDAINSAVSAYVEQREAYADLPNGILHRAIELRFKDFASYISEVDQKNIVEVGLDHLLTIALESVQTSNSLIEATSYVSSDEWWKRPWGRRYLEANRERIENGVKIKRIFIFEDRNSMNQDMDLLDCNYAYGVEVWVLFESELNHPIAEDVIIIDHGELAGQLVFEPGRRMSTSYFSADRDFVDRRRAVFQTALLNSIPYEPDEGEDTSCRLGSERIEP